MQASSQVSTSSLSSPRANPHVGTRHSLRLRTGPQKPLAQEPKSNQEPVPEENDLEYYIHKTRGEGKVWIRVRECTECGEAIWIGEKRLMGCYKQHLNSPRCQAAALKRKYSAHCDEDGVYLIPEGTKYARYKRCTNCGRHIGLGMGKTFHTMETHIESDQCIPLPEKKSIASFASTSVTGLTTSKYFKSQGYEAEDSINASVLYSCTDENSARCPSAQTKRKASAFENDRPLMYGGATHILDEDVAGGMGSKRHKLR